MSTRIPLRHRLVTRLLAVTVVTVVLAVAATAWLATRSATHAVQQQRGDSLAAQQALYDAMVGFGATHRGWSGVGAVVADEARRVHGRVTLATADGRILADSTHGRRPPTSDPVATVDPLHVAPSLAHGRDTIDPRAVGPFRLGDAEAARALLGAKGVVACLGKIGVGGRVVPSSNRHPLVVASGADPGDPGDEVSRCASSYAHVSLPSEAREIERLQGLTETCLGLHAGEGAVAIIPNWNAAPPTFATVVKTSSATAPARVQDCLERSRRRLLRPYVARPALLYVSSPTGTPVATSFSLSRRNVAHIVLLALVVLAIAVLVTVLLGRRLVRPLRLLAEDADTGGSRTPALAGGHDEIGRLARALGEASARRDRAEAQRRAMVSDIAHELRSPLTSIRSWIEAAQDGLAPVDRDLVDLVHEETGVVTRILDDLADLAAADAGTLRLHPEPLDLRSSLRAVVDAHGGAAATTGVVLTLTDGDPVPVFADPLRLRQVATNLVGNAIRYTPSGGTVRVTCAAGPDTAVLEVADTGIGIDAADLPHVFERFWRADASRSRATGGSGLGLAIVRQLVDGHGGDVRVTSEAGHGSTFTVVLASAPPDGDLT